MTQHSAPRRRVVGGLTAALLAGTLTSCSLLGEEHVCSGGEFPVYATSNSTGATCVKDGDPAPDGFAAYPKGRVPEVVGDRYDRWPLAKNYPWRDEVDLAAPRRPAPR